MARGKKLSAKERVIKLEQDKVYRQHVFKELLQHIRKGSSLDCFSLLSDVTIREYMKKYPLEFIEEELVEAMRDAKDYWEGLGRRQAEGTCLGNSRSWYYNMSNRFGWSDRQHIDAKVEGNVSVNVISYTSKKTDTQALKD